MTKNDQKILSALQWGFLLLTLGMLAYTVYGYAASAEGVLELLQDYPITVLEWGMAAWLALHLAMKRESPILRLIPCVGLTVCRLGMLLASWMTFRRFESHLHENWFASWNGFEYSSLLPFLAGIVLCIYMIICMCREEKTKVLET